MFDVETTMESIREEIRKKNISVPEQYFTTSYYEQRIRECREKKNIIIFGSGKNGQILYSALQQEGINTIKGFCDNAKEKQGTLVSDMPVYSVEEALKQFPDAYFIVTVSSYENEILRQLIKLKVSVDNIALFIMKYSGLTEV